MVRPGPNETLKIESRRQRTAELYLRGTRDIPGLIHALADLGFKVSKPTLSRDLQEIRQRWKETTVRDFDAAIVEELSKLDQIEREAWAAWDRSKKPRERQRVGEKQVGEGKELSTTIETEGRAGDPRFLEKIQWCIDRRCKLLGLDAPDKIEDVTPARPIEVIIETREEASTFQEWARASRISGNN